ncbi:hypothetical protein OF83DRAFT_253822 [Amylostereum chailletii]|nr:hypothetical protein OF83DRAFT_253822 [Amylostereum chailletii]
MLKFRLTRDKKPSQHVQPQNLDIPPDPRATAGTTSADPSSASSPVARHNPSGASPLAKAGSVPLALEGKSKLTPTDPTSPTTLASPNLMRKASKGFLGALRMRPSHADPQSPTSPTDARTRPTPPLPNDFTSKARRDEALRARGLLPPAKVKDLSQLEAEENRRLPISPVIDSETSSEPGTSAARAIMDSWRAQNEGLLKPNDSADAEENIARASPKDVPLPLTPPSSTHRLPLTPPATPPKSPRPAGPRARSSPSHSPRASVSQSRSSHEGRARSPSETESAEKVSQWLQHSPGRSPTKRTKPRTSEDSARERLVGSALPRSPTAATHSGEHPQDPPKSSSQLSHSTASDLPDVPSYPFLPRSPTSKRARPAHLAPVIVESAEESPLCDEPHIQFAVEQDVPFLAQEFGAFDGHQTAPPLIATFPVPRPRPRPSKADEGGAAKKKTENRKSLGFMLGKKRAGTLQPEPLLAKPSSLGNLRRAMTTRSKPAPSPLPCPPGIAEVPAVPLSPTMHNQGTILLGVKTIEDEESRRLSEMAFML